METCGEDFDPKTRKSKRKSSITKNERYRMLLRVAMHHQVRFPYVLNGVWFATSDNMKFVKHQRGKEFVIPLKENRKVALSGDEKKSGQYVAVSTLESAGATTPTNLARRSGFPAASEHRGLHERRRINGRALSGFKRCDTQL